MTNCSFAEMRGVRQNLPAAEKQEFFTLDTYLLMAQKIIKKYANKERAGLCNQMLKSEDAISDVAYMMMRADWAFDPTKGSSRNTFRVRNGIHAIQIYLRNQNSSKNKEYIPIDQVYEVKPEEAEVKEKPEVTRVNFLMKHTNLNDMQRKIIQLHYYEGLTYREIGQQLGISDRAAHQTLHRALRKLRFTGGVS